MNKQVHPSKFHLVGGFPFTTKKGAAELLRILVPESCAEPSVTQAHVLSSLVHEAINAGWEKTMLRVEVGAKGPWAISWCN